MSSHRHEDIFISFRYTESLTEACVLKNVLESKGISVYINDSHSGVNMAAEIAEKLEKCTLVVIMGTETYGVKTKSINSTFEELQFIYENKQFFLVKMCREFKLCKGHKSRFQSLYAQHKEPLTKLLLGGSIKYKIWMPDTKMPSELVEAIICRLEEFKKCDKTSWNPYQISPKQPTARLTYSPFPRSLEESLGHCTTAQQNKNTAEFQPNNTATTLQIKPVPMQGQIPPDHSQGYKEIIPFYTQGQVTEASTFHHPLTPFQAQRKPAQSRARYSLPISQAYLGSVFSVTHITQSNWPMTHLEENRSTYAQAYNPVMYPQTKVAEIQPCSALTISQGHLTGRSPDPSCTVRPALVGNTSHSRNIVRNICGKIRKNLSSSDDTYV